MELFQITRLVKACRNGVNEGGSSNRFAEIINVFRVEGKVDVLLPPLIALTGSCMTPSKRETSSTLPSSGSPGSMCPLEDRPKSMIDGDLVRRCFKPSTMCGVIARPTNRRLRRFENIASGRSPTIVVQNTTVKLLNRGNFVKEHSVS